MRMETAWAGSGSYGYAGGRVQQLFQVDMDCLLTVEWDVSGTDSYTFVTAGTDDASGQTTLASFQGSSDPLVGTFVI